MKIKTMMLISGFAAILLILFALLPRDNQALKQVATLGETEQQQAKPQVIQQAQLPLESPTPFPTEPFVQFSYTPVPTPNMMEVPGLEKVTFANFRALTLPSKTHTYFYDSSWSPNSKFFAGYYAPWMEGQYIVEVHVGNVDTGEFYRFEENGAWPLWSSDSEYIYFLATRSDESQQRSYYDFFRKSLRTANVSLVIQNVEPLYAPPIQFSELPNGQLLTWDRNHQLVILPDANTLSKAPTELAEVTPITYVTGLQESAQTQDVPGTLQPSFSLSPHGKLILLVLPSGTSKIIDLATNSVIGELDGPEVAANTAWSSDENLIAFTTYQGLYVHDLTTHSTQQLVKKQDLGFREDDMQSGLSQPVWLSNDQNILFTGVSPEWLTVIAGDWHVGYFAFVVSKDGKLLKSLGAYGVDSVSPDKAHAIIRKQDPDSGYFGVYLVDISQ